MRVDDQASISAAMDALASWDIEVQSAEVYSRSENVVVRIVDRQDAVYALRIHRPGYNSIEELRAELIWETALNQSGIATPPHVLTRAGEGYVEVAINGRPYQVGLIRWIPGKILDELIHDAGEADQVHYFAQLGRLLAVLHQHTAGWQPDQSFVRRSWNADGLVGSDPLWGRFWEASFLDQREAQVFRKARDVIHERLLSIGEDPAVYGLIHADLHPRNVIVHDGTLQAIDFDDSGFGWHYYDLAVALREFIGHERYVEFRDAMLEGYRFIRALPLAEERLPLFLCVRGLVTVGWAAARPEIVNPEQMKPHVSNLVGELSEL